MILARFLTGARQIPGGNRLRAGVPAVRALFAAACLAWAAPRAARSGGFEYGANGAAAVGRTGAFVVRGDNPSTLYYNVAGMGRMEDGTHVLLDCNLVLRTLAFRRAGTMNFAPSIETQLHVRGLPYPEIEDEAGIHAAPFFAVVSDLGLDSDFVFGLGVFGPAAVGRGDYPTQVGVVNNDGETTLVPAPQRYDILYEDIVFIWPTLAAAWRITDDLTVGAGFQSGVVHIIFQTVAAAASNRLYENVIFDIMSSVDVWDRFVPAGILGVWYRPWKYIETALSLRVSDTISADGDLITVSNPYGVGGQDPVASDRYDDYNEAAGEHAPTADLSFAWPTVVLRGGVRFVWPRDTGEIVGDEIDPSIESRLARMPPFRREWFDIELDVTYEMNSAVDSFRTKVWGVVPSTDPGLRPLSVRPTGDPDTEGILFEHHNWKDTAAVRLGGDVNVLDGDLSLHWGLMFESETVPLKMTRLDYAGWETYGVAGGVTVRLPWYGIEMTASYMHQFMPDREVEDGGARIIAAIVPPDESFVPVINNGVYRGSLDVFSIGALASF